LACLLALATRDGLAQDDGGEKSWSVPPLLPAETLVVAWTPNITKAGAAFTETGLGRLARLKEIEAQRAWISARPILMILAALFLLAEVAVRGLRRR
jgi:hypothetical protein